MNRKHERTDWLMILLKIALVVEIAVLIIASVKYFTSDKDTPPERVATEMIDDSKYLVTYKQKINHHTVYTSMIVDKEGGD